MKEMDHRISKSHPEAELFESTFKVKLSDNISYRNSSYSKSTISISGNYFNVLFDWDKERIESLYESVRLFNLKSKVSSVYVLNYNDKDYDDDRIWDANFSIGIYDKKLKSELFNNPELKRTIFNGQNYNNGNDDYKMWCRKNIINKVLN